MRARKKRSVGNRQVMSDGESSPGEITELLERGLDLYGHNDVESAIRCWRQALALDPDNARVRDYLECAGAPLEPLATIVNLDAMRAQLGFGDKEGTPLPGAVVSTDDDTEPQPPSERVRKSMIERLLRDGRYEEALDLLYQIRARRPHDVGLSRSIRLLRERLALSHAARLKNLDWIPVLEPTLRGAALSPEEREVAALIDGVSSYGDIVASCTLGRLNTLRILCAFVDQGVARALSNTPGYGAGASGEMTAPRTDRSPSSQSSQVADSSPPQSIREPDPYTALFSEATQAYLVRDYQRAADLFSRCCEERPDDRRAQHNLKTLRRRLQSQ